MTTQAKTIPIRGVAGGIYPDLPPYDLSISQWSFGHNISVVDNAITSSKGFVEALGATTGYPRYFFDFAYGDGPALAYVADDGKVYYLVAENVHNLYPQPATPVLLNVASGKKITQADFANLIYLNDTVNAPRVYDRNYSVDAREITNFPANTTCEVLRSYKNYLIMGNTTESNVRYPQKIWWSNAMEPNTDPSTWVPGTTNQAGTTYLQDTPGSIVDIVLLGDAAYVYKSDSVVRMQWVGGNSVFSFRTTFREGGLLSQGCAVEFEGKHYCLGPDDAYVHDGNVKVSIAEKKVRKTLFKALDRSLSHKAFVFAYTKAREIWFCIPTSGQRFNGSITHDACDKAYVYDIDSEAWTTRDLPNIINLTSTVMLASSADVWQTPPGNDWTWDDTRDDGITWKDPSYSLRDSALTAASPTRQSLIHMDYADSYFGLPYASHLEKAVYDWSEAGLTLDQVKYTHRVWPIMSGTGNVALSYAATMDINAQPSYKATKIYSALKRELKFDIRNTGKVHYYRFTMTTPGHFRLTGFDINLSISGRR